MSWERFDDSPEGALRDAPPDVRTPIDPDAPVSGHRPPPTPIQPGADSLPSASAEHDWSAASDHVYPVLRPIGTGGTMLAELNEEQIAAEGMKNHARPLIDPGPAGLAIAYVLREPSFDVMVNADHLLTWGVHADQLREKAIANLRAWSESAPWKDELAGERRLLSSDTGEGNDAARILLPEARRKIAGQCGGPARVLIALPDRDLLVAGSLQPGDGEFAGQFAAFAADVADGAHEPIAHELFELVGDEPELVLYAG